MNVSKKAILKWLVTLPFVLVLTGLGELVYQMKKVVKGKEKAERVWLGYAKKTDWFDGWISK